MESTGVPGQIQLSEDSYNSILEVDKNIIDEFVFHRREVLIEAKGKGQLVTYFLNVHTKPVVEGEIVDVNSISVEDSGNVELISMA